VIYSLLLIPFIAFFVLSVVSISPALSQGATPHSPVIHIPEHEAEVIGQKIWLNETGGKLENLIVWNTGESFASLGIGHFIWYPQGQEGPFQESFPELLQFLQNKNIVLPSWLHPNSDCPWKTKEDFFHKASGVEMHDLQTLLTQTIPQQTQFLIQRLESAVPKILTQLPTEEERVHVQRQFYRVASTPTGLYALVDYVNFKGEGIAPTERYQGQGWGLLQVLQQMPGDSSNPVFEFADAAEIVLTRGVKNAPPERREIENRWLSGWKARLTTYRQF
jgi:hypothetical protein